MSSDTGNQTANTANLYASQRSTGAANGTLHASAPAQPVTHSPLGADQVSSMAIWLAVIIGLILVGGYLFKRFGGVRDRRGEAIRIVASRSLGQRERVVVTEIGDTRLVLGVTSHSITRLHCTDAAPPDTETHANPGTPTFAEALSSNIRRMSGRSTGRRDRL